MTTPYLFVPVFTWPTAPGGKLHTYAAGGTTPQGTWSDAAGTVPNANPVVLDTNGEAVVRLTSGLAYHFVLKDSTDTTTLWDADNYQASYLTQSDVGGLLYPRTAAEIAASVTPTNFVSPSSTMIGGGNVNRYQTNTIPGTTDMSTGFAAAAASNTVFSVPPGSYLTNSVLSQATYAAITQGATFSGTNPFLAWAPSFNGVFQVAATGNQNGFVSMVRNNLSASTNSEPTAITAMGRNDNNGNVVFGLYAPGYQYANTGVAVGAEIDSFNMTVVPSAALPPNRAIGTSGNFPIALTVGAGGNFNSSIGIEIVREGSMPQSFLTGIYFDWTACTTYGIFIDALLQSTFTAAVLKASSAQPVLQLQSSGAIFGVAITGIAGQFSCTATSLSVGMQVTIAGTFGGTGSITGYSNPTTYLISATNGSTTFTLQTLGSAPIVTTAGTPTGLTYTAIVPTGSMLISYDANGVERNRLIQQGGYLVSGTQVVGTQQTTAVTSASFTANAGTAINTLSTFDGYTVPQVVKALRTHGLLQ